jgi:hypothetical protein
MTFKEKVEASPVVFFLGALLAGFVAGMSTYKAILSMAQLTTISQHDLDTLRAKADKLDHEAEENGAQTQNAATIPKIVLPRTWVSERKSVTTEDGSCLIHLDYVSVYDVELSVAVGAEQPQKFKNVTPGTRLSVLTQGAVYYVDVHEILEKQVGIEVTRQSIPSSTKK